MIFRNARRHQRAPAQRVIESFQYSCAMRPHLRSRSDGLACIVLAAGGSHRLGRSKQLVRYRQRALLLNALDAAEAVAPGHVVVVLGADALRLRALLKRNGSKAVIVGNRRWQEGLAGSLKAGLAAAPPSARAVLVTLCDQPAVDATALYRLVDAWRRRPTVAAAARYSGGTGVPAILPRSLWAQVRELDGDAGARSILRGSTGITAVDMPEAELDIDTTDDLAKLRK